MVISHTEFIAYTRPSECAHPNFGTIVSIPIAALNVAIHIDFFATSSDTLALVFIFNLFCRVIAVLLDIHHFRNDDCVVFQQCVFGNESG
jgi:ABC-type proline/glycine betaine transport system permease subunit